MKSKRRAFMISALFLLVLSISLLATGCGGSEGGESDVTKITIVQQYGMAYAPFKVMEEQSLVESNYKGEGTLEVEYSVLNSGSSINDAFLSGDVQVGAMGVAPAITGTMSDAGYKICSNMSAQPHRIMTNNPKIKTLKDIGAKDQIALVNLGSFQHILLAMACEQQLGDAHALDNNIAAMAHPDGMTALLNKQVACQLTTSPYVFKEAAEGMTEVKALSEVWPEGNSFIVAVASKDLHDNDPEAYQAVVDAIAEAIEYLNNNKEEAAELLCANEDVDAETMLEWLNDPACVYDTQLKGVMDMADFMAENKFLEVEGPSDISDLVFDNVQGE